MTVFRFILVSLPATFLCWRFAAWLRDPHKWESPVWRRVASFAVFVIALANAIAFLLLHVYVSVKHFPNYWDPVLMNTTDIGLLVTVPAILIGLIGKGKLRWQSVISLAYFGFWFFVEIYTR